MSEQSNIAWTDSTHNFWRGCTKVSPGCTNCYAERLVTTRLADAHYRAAIASGKWHATASHRSSGIPLWGKGAPRVRSKDFNAPLRWNRKPVWCEHCGFTTWDNHTPADHTNGLLGFCDSLDDYCEIHRRRVFSLSLGDWLDPEIPVEWLADMLNIIRQADQLQWILCTKRPEQWQIRIDKLTTWDDPLHTRPQLACWLEAWRMGKAPPNICILASVENQETANERMPHLLKIPATIRGISLEPMLGPVIVKDLAGIGWAICGGESGPKARPCNIEWIRSIVKQCQSAGVACFVKQLGAKPVGITDRISHKGDTTKMPDGFYRYLTDKAGADPAEWPEDLRVRQFPKGMM